MARKEDAKQVYGTINNGAEFEAYLKESGISMNEAINRGLSLLMLDKMRGKAPDQAAAIEDFMVHTNTLLDFFRQAIERSLTADERAKADVKSQLDGMATLAESNKRLEEEKSLILEMKSKLELQVAEQQEKIKHLQSELEAARTDASELQRLKKRCAELTQEKADILVKHNEEIAALQKENFEKMLEVVKAAK